MKRSFNSKKVFLICFVVSVALNLPHLAMSSEETDTLAKALHFYKVRDFQEALNNLQSLEGKVSPSGEIYYWLGKVHFQLMQPKDAAGFYEEAIELGYQIADVHFGLGQAYGAWAMEASIFTQARLAGKIRRAFEKALELDADHFDANVALMMFYEQAPGFMGGNFKKAVVLGEKARSLKPVDGSHALAGMYMRKKKVEKALVVFEELAKEFPENPDHQVSILALMLEAERFDNWLKSYANFEEQYGDHGAAQYQFGKYGALTGDQLEQAEACLNIYLSMEPQPDDPSHASAFWRLRQVFEHQGRIQEALEAVNQAIELEPSEDRFRKAQKRLARSSLRKR